jgi:glyoxylase-like metal-dependent hydrolase (beta-lactamase superfamily II)
VPALEAAGFPPDTVDVVAMSHLHFDHAGGLLLTDGSRAFPRASIVAQRAEWEVALSDNSRVVASYVQPELTLVHDWGAEGWAEGERELLPGVSVVPTGGHSTGHQAIVVRGGGAGGRTLAFFGDLLMRPWAANPRWVTSFDDFPLDSVLRKGELFAQAADEDWIVVLSHEGEHPIGRLVRDRDRFRYEAG